MGLRLLLGGMALISAGLMNGCGTIQANSATEQLLASDAVDSAISSIDFRPLAGQKVFFDTKYIPIAQKFGVISPEYVISSLRQAMVGAGLLLQESQADADYIVEARVGTLGSDGSEMTYGIPSSSTGIAAAAAAASGGIPSLPSIPEISLAKRKNQLAAAKVACFAYERTSRERIWQSGLATAKSTAQDAWVLGAGPFQKGSIYTKTGIAGSTLDVSSLGEDQSAISYRQSAMYGRIASKEEPPEPPATAEVITASEEASPAVTPAGGEAAAGAVVPASAETPAPAVPPATPDAAIAPPAAPAATPAPTDAATAPPAAATPAPETPGQATPPPAAPAPAAAPPAAATPAPAPTAPATRIAPDAPG